MSDAYDALEKTNKIRGQASPMKPKKTIVKTSVSAACLRNGLRFFQGLWFRDWGFRIMGLGF